MHNLLALPQSFYNRNVVEVAQDLLGKTLVFGIYQGIITETEAYRGLDDEASHAFRGKTKRSTIMFGPPGYAYVYFIYGMHYCFNIVSEENGQAAAVLIRGLQLPGWHLNGPGKICKHLGITKEHNGVNLCTDRNLYVSQGIKVDKFISTARIGIRKAKETPWRFLINL